MVALEIDLNVKVEPTVSNSPNVHSSVLSVLDLNAINKLNITRDMGEATWSRKVPGTKGASVVYVPRMWRHGILRYIITVTCCGHSNLCCMCWVSLVLRVLESLDIKKYSRNMSRSINISEHMLAYNERLKYCWSHIILHPHYHISSIYSVP